MHYFHFSYMIYWLNILKISRQCKAKLVSRVTTAHHQTLPWDTKSSPHHIILFTLLQLGYQSSPFTSVNIIVTIATAVHWLKLHILHPSMFYMTCKCHFPWSDQHNNIWWLIKLCKLVHLLLFSLPNVQIPHTAHCPQTSSNNVLAFK